MNDLKHFVMNALECQLDVKCIHAIYSFETKQLWGYFTTESNGLFSSYLCLKTATQFWFFSDLNPHIFSGYNIFP